MPLKLFTSIKSIRRKHLLLTLADGEEEGEEGERKGGERRRRSGGQGRKKKVGGE